jgi:hypothetical protein
MNSGPLIQESLVPTKNQKVCGAEILFPALIPTVSSRCGLCCRSDSDFTNGTLGGGRQGRCESPLARRSADL